MIKDMEMTVPTWAQCHQKDSHTRGRRVCWNEDDVMTETRRHYATGFDAGERGHTPMQAASRSWKGQGNKFSPEASSRNQPS